MSQDSTRRLLKSFGIAVTNLEEALEAGEGDSARRAASELRERLKDVIELVEGMDERAKAL